MIASTDYVSIIFGSLGGLAALVVAINTVLLRREAKEQKDSEKTTTNRMDTFETSQASLQSALMRADIENERLRSHLAAQDVEITKLKEEVAALRHQVEELHRAN